MDKPQTSSRRKRIAGILRSALHQRRRNWAGNHSAYDKFIRGENRWAKWTGSKFAHAPTRADKARRSQRAAAAKKSESVMNFIIVSNFSEGGDPEERKLRLHKIKKHAQQQKGAAKLAYGASVKAGGEWGGNNSNPKSGGALHLRGDIHRASGERASQVLKKWKKHRHQRGPENRTSRTLGMAVKLAKRAEKSDKHGHSGSYDYSVYRRYPGNVADEVKKGGYKKRSAASKRQMDLVKSQWTYTQGRRAKAKANFNKSLSGGR
jgi:hypothetical protein